MSTDETPSDDAGGDGQGREDAESGASVDVGGESESDVTTAEVVDVEDDADMTPVETETDPDLDTEADGEGMTARERLEAEADRAVTEFDEGIVDLLAWILDTETRARIYVFLRQNPDATSEEVADGTGLYPSTVREALAELHDEEKVTRHKRQSAGAGNNPYEYRAIAPSELVRGVVDQVQHQLNTVFNLDRRLGTDDSDDVEPVSITVDDD
jgi:predicted transcriptional regulator